jgi:hypothetical protein
MRPLAFLAGLVAMFSASVLGQAVWSRAYYATDVSTSTSVALPPVTPIPQFQKPGEMCAVTVHDLSQRGAYKSMTEEVVSFYNCVATESKAMHFVQTFWPKVSEQVRHNCGTESTFSFYGALAVCLNMHGVKPDWADWDGN